MNLVELFVARPSDCHFVTVNLLHFVNVCRFETDRFQFGRVTCSLKKKTCLLVTLDFVGVF